MATQNIHALLMRIRKAPQPYALVPDPQQSTDPRNRTTLYFAVSAISDSVQIVAETRAPPTRPREDEGMGGTPALSSSARWVHGLTLLRHHSVGGGGRGGGRAAVTVRPAAADCPRAGTQSIANHLLFTAKLFDFRFLICSWSFADRTCPMPQTCVRERRITQLYPSPPPHLTLQLAVTR